jgi:hypothetical protein
VGYQYQPLGQKKFPLRAGNTVRPRTEVNMKSRMVKLALAVAVLFLLSSASFAQAPYWGQHDRDDRWSNWGYQNGNEPYERGVHDGREDREHNRGWHPRNQGQKYLNGYRAGYGRDGGGWQGRRNDHDADDNGPYRGGYNNGQYGNVPYGNNNNAQSVAYNNGFQEGLGYGAADKNNRHSYRPTYSRTYQNGTHGYNSSMGSQTAYKHAYQDGFRAGYDRGFNGGGYRR